MHRFANPRRFRKLADAILPWSMGIMAAAFAVGIYMALITSPADFKQGESVRIMYIHVPSAWMALLTYTIIAVASGVSIIWRHPLADLAAKSAAPVGLAFTGLALITGSLWGKPMWGDWWVWDARLTSVLVLFFLYLGYIAIWQAIEDQNQASRAAAILALVGFVNVPIIKFSVEWWSTLHQPASVIRLDGPTIDGSMLVPLLVMVLAFKAYFITVLLWRMKAELVARKLQVLRLKKAQGA
ncbi:MAG: heme ABC transporter permease [Proteobacteria bacterium]|nr:heme ABC transporter permease [Pseudomonadota bacterium]